MTFDLADELSPALARDLFDADGADMMPKRELAEIHPILDIGRQIMTVRPHPDLDPLGRLAGVELRKVRISKSDAGTWMVSWLAMFPFEERTVIGLIKHLKLGVYLTFELEAPALPFDGKAAAAGPDDESDLPADNVTPITARRGRGRPKGSRNRRNPDAVAADQIADARNRADADPDLDAMAD